MLKALILTASMTAAVISDQAAIVMDTFTNLNYPTLEDIEALTEQDVNDPGI